MSLGKAMIHARKQKSIARAAAFAGEPAVVHSNHLLQMPVLVLNASYEPINICGARRALVLVLKGIARTEEEHGLMLHAQRNRIAVMSSSSCSRRLPFLRRQFDVGESRGLLPRMQPQKGQSPATRA